DAGCSLLTVHGRQRGSQRHGRKGPANLEEVAFLKTQLRIPVICNGNIRCAQDVVANLLSTGADGVMSAEGVLSNAAVFAQAKQLEEGKEPGMSNPREAALEYLQCAEQYPTPFHIVHQHVACMLGLAPSTEGASWVQRKAVAERNRVREDRMRARDAAGEAGEEAQ
ncbi:dihydrouridine synthase-domain-containing protein, partial [Baffinella frigidus]